MKSWICIFLTIMVTACFQNRDTQLQIAESLMSGQPDSAIIVLNNIDNIHTLSEVNAARYAVLLSSAHQAAGVSLCEDSLIVSALRYYERQRDTLNMETVSMLAADYFYENGEITEAETLLKQGVELARLRGDKNRMVDFYRNLAQVSNNNRTTPDCDKVLGYLHACITLRNSADDYFYYGMFLALASRDSADYFINRGISIATENKDAGLGRYLLHYASYLTKKQEYGNALQVLNRVDSIQISDREKKISYLNQARINLLLSHVNEAENSLNKINPLLCEKDMVNENIKLQLENIIDYVRNRNINMTYLSRYNDSIYVSILKKNDALLAKTEAKHKLIQQNLELRIERQYITIAVISIFFIVIIIVALYDYRRKQSIISLQKQLERNRIEMMQAQNRTEESEIPLEDNLKQIHKLRLEKIELCRDAFFRTAWGKRLATINCQTVTAELTGKESYDLTDTLTRYFADVMIDLKQDCPKLNSEELLYCVFLLLECSNRTISICTFTVEGTIRTRKTRMKDKLSDEYRSILFSNMSFAMI